MIDARSAAVAIGDDMQWYHKAFDNELGPLSFQELTQMVRDGTVTEDDLVRPDYLQVWQRAETVIGLFSMARRKRSEVEKTLCEAESCDGKAVSQSVSPLIDLEDRNAESLSRTGVVGHHDRANRTEGSKIHASTEDTFALSDPTTSSFNSSGIDSSNADLASRPPLSGSSVWQHVVREAVAAIDARQPTVANADADAAPLSGVLPRTIRVLLWFLFLLRLPFTIAVALVRAVTNSPRRYQDYKPLRRPKLQGAPLKVSGPRLNLLSLLRFGSFSFHASPKEWVVKFLESAGRLCTSSVCHGLLRLIPPVVCANVAGYMLLSWSSTESLRFPSADQRSASLYFPLIGSCGKFTYWFLFIDVVLIVMVTSYLTVKLTESYVSDS